MNLVPYWQVRSGFRFLFPTTIRISTIRISCAGSIAETRYFVETLFVTSEPLAIVVLVISGISKFKVVEPSTLP